MQAHRRRILGLVALWSAACEPAPRESFREVGVRGVDHAFLAPDTVAAGLTAFSFINTGTVWHEMKLIALRPGSGRC